MIKTVNKYTESHEDRNFIYFRVSYIGIRICSENIVSCGLSN